MKLPAFLKNANIDGEKKVVLTPHFEDVTCTGNSYDMGFQQGKRYRHKILRNEKILEETELFRKFVPSFIPLPFLLNTAKKFIPLFIPSVLSTEKHIMQRLDGIADGAGVNRELIFLAQTLEIILDHIPYNLGCTTVAISPERYITGEPVIIKNFDFLDNFRALNIIRKSVPEGGIQSLELSFTSIAGAHTGMNKAGLAISYNYGYSKEPQQPRVPITCHIQTVLEKYGSTEESVNFLINKPFAAGAIITICDSNARMVTIEGSPSRKALNYPDKNGLMINTNLFATSEMQPVNIPGNATFDNNMPYNLNRIKVHESNRIRAACAGNMLNSEKRISPETLIGLLASHGPDNNAYDNCLCRHIPIFHTVASAIMFPASKTAYFLIGSPCKKKYHKYRF